MELSLGVILSQMYRSMTDNNYWDSEAYAEIALEYLNAGKPINASIDRNEMTDFLNQVITAARSELEKEKQKKALIEEIVNFKG